MIHLALPSKVVTWANLLPAHPARRWAAEMPVLAPVGTCGPAFPRGQLQTVARGITACEASMGLQGEQHWREEGEQGAGVVRAQPHFAAETANHREANTPALCQSPMGSFLKTHSP